MHCFAYAENCVFPVMQTRKNLVQLLFLLQIRQVSRHLCTFALTTRTPDYMNQAMGHPKVTEKSQHNPAPLLSSDKLERLQQKGRPA